MRDLYLCDDTDLNRIADECRRLGCGIEVQSFYDPTYRNTHLEAIEKHREALQDIPHRALHGPFGDLSAGSFDGEIRRVTRMRFEQAIATASELGIGRIILHHGYIPGTNSPTGWLKRITQFWQNLLATVPSDMAIRLENVLERDGGLIADVIDAIGDPRLTICLDTGHAHFHGRISVADWAARLGPRIGYVHLHDNHGESDEHLALGDGTMDWIAVLDALQEHAPDAIWAIESTRDTQIERAIGLLVQHDFWVRPSGS